jgi:23S rRNA (cytidine1920-2'-O)/16S rRNA (cytidine1409-2'-O)-methyltransferase
VTATDRLDKVLVARGLVRSRTEAQALIAEAQVSVDGAIVRKPSLAVADTTQVAILGERLAYVSRGGLKLVAAIDRFAIAVAGRSALDVGASTGGWTDCLLQRGIRHVLALDVGHGQMAEAVAADPRVESREGVNARFLSPDDFPTSFDLIVADLSFISLTLILPTLTPLLAPDGDMVVLVKPQFEVGVAGLGKGGIVRDRASRQAALERVAATAQGLGLREDGRMDSPILGSNGNQEYLLWLRAGTADLAVE